MDLNTTDAGAAAPASETVAAPVTTAAETVAAPVTEAAKPTIDDTLRAAWDKINPKRAPDGKFAPRANGAAAPAEGAETNLAATAAPETTTSTDQPESAKPETTQPAASSIEPPHSWSAEAKAKWASVPPDLQAVIAKREADAHQAITRSGEQIAAFKPLGEVIDKFAETFQRNGLPPHEGVARMLAVEQWLGSDPQAAVVEIAKAYGVDLRRLAGDQPAAAEGTSQPGAQPDPLVSTLQSQQAALVKEVNQLKSYLTAQQRAQHESEQSALSRQIADFAKDPKFPHFEAVRKTMAKLMEADDGLSMTDAYERATYAIPDIRNRILADQRKAEEDKAAKDKADRLAAAKKAGALNVTSTTAAGKAAKTMDDTLREVASRHYG